MSTMQNENAPQFSYQVEFVKDEMVYFLELGKYDAVFSGYSITNPDLCKARYIALIKAQLLANDNINLDGKIYPTQVFLRDKKGEIDLLVHDTRGLTDDILQNIETEYELVRNFYEDENDWIIQLDTQKHLEDSIKKVPKFVYTNSHIYMLPKLKHRFISLKRNKDKVFLIRGLYGDEGILLTFKMNEAENVY